MGKKKFFILFLIGTPKEQRGSATKENDPATPTANNHPLGTPKAIHTTRRLLLMLYFFKENDPLMRSHQSLSLLSPYSNFSSIRGVCWGKMNKNHFSLSGYGGFLNLSVLVVFQTWVLLLVA